MKRIAVIGGGASGMMAALAAARNGAEVTLFEKNEKLGKKLYITGKGRCNVTNACDGQDFFLNIPTNSRFLYSAFSAFSNEDLMTLIEKEGCPLKIERGKRVFPKSDKSSDIIKTFEKMLRREKVHLKLNSKVDSLWTEEGMIKGLVCEGRKQNFDAVVIATGGLSYKATGSTGDGYKMAREAGHTVVETLPSLVPLLSDDPVCAGMKGLSLKNIRLTLREGKKEKFSEIGEMMFTDFGITGPLVLSASAHISDRKYVDTRAEIDLKPGLSMEQLDARILRDFGESQNKQIRNVLRQLFPERLIDAVLKKSEINGQKPVNEITRAERVRLAETTKAFTLPICGVRPINEAIITRGGINTREINPSTMQSKRVPGLYFCGEVMDVDAYTGGFNLQIAFSTGYLAGSSATTD